MADAVEIHVVIGGEDGIVNARGKARDLAKQLGFNMLDQSRIATAVSELARNVVRYATDSRGEMTARSIAPPPGRSVGIEIVVSDSGPGIHDIEQAMSVGFTSGPGMGMGLPGTKRLMDEMILHSAPGEGTSVTIRKWRR
jgi:serine/threonine-protein kinase RsbT